jgi:hypothetical protein
MREGPQAIDTKADPPASEPSSPALTFGAVDAVRRRQSGKLGRLASPVLNHGRVNRGGLRLLFACRLIGAAQPVEQAPQRVSSSHSISPVLLG